MDKIMSKKNSRLKLKDLTASKAEARRLLMQMQLANKASLTQPKIDPCLSA